MFTHKLDIEQLKQYPISDYLSSKGIQPFNKVGNQIAYHSPITDERTASFLVEPKKNVFNDYSSGQKGDIITLIKILERMTFSEAIKRLQALKSGESAYPFSFSGKQSDNNRESKIEIAKIQEITNYALIQYIEKRGINIDLARIYLKEIHFKNKGKMYFAVGFRNDAGGYELRNSLFKGKSANGITVFDEGTKQVNLFEGFFDFLSGLQHFGGRRFKNTTVVLNTNSNIQLFMNTIPNYQVIHSFLDNDKSGMDIFNKIANKGIKAYNQSEIIYPNYKDFNDFVMNIGLK